MDLYGLIEVLILHYMISNTNFYETTQGLEFSWVIDGDGCIRGSGILSFPLINPQSSIDIEWESSPWYSSWASCSAEEIFLTISARLVNSIRWVGAGHVISSMQVELPTRRKILPHVIEIRDAKIVHEMHGDIFQLRHDGVWEINFNIRTGAIESWKVSGVNVMNKGIFPCFWRAPTDNDKGGDEGSYYSRWKAAHMDNVVFIAKSCSVQNATDHLVKIAVVYTGIPKGDESSLSNTLFEIDMVYTIYGSGDVIMECNVKPKSDLPPLPRVGIEFQLDFSLGDMQWADVRWVTFLNENGFEIYASAYGSSPPMQLSASCYTTTELERATHYEELKKGDGVEVHLDHKHMGVGGDDSWSPCVHDKYLIPPMP